VGFVGVVGGSSTAIEVMVGGVGVVAVWGDRFGRLAPHRWGLSPSFRRQVTVSVSGRRIE
jgi:hypothetical protein